MTKIYRFQTDEAFRHLTFESDEDANYFFRIHRQQSAPLPDARFKLKVVGEEKHIEKPFGDFVGFSSNGLLVDGATRDILSDFLCDSGNWFEMEFKETRLYYFFITKVLDVLDKVNTEFQMQDGYVVDIKKYAFLEAGYDSAPIFKIPSGLGYEPFVTQGFVDFIESNSLRGLLLSHVNT